MGFYILGYKQPHAAPPGAPRIARSRASPCPPAAPPDPAAAYILGYMDGFQMWRSGLSRRPHSAARVTPSAPKPRAPSQCSRHDVPARPAVRLPPFASRRSLPAVPVTPLAPKPGTLSQCSRHDVPARPAARTPPPLSRRPRPGGLRRLARCAPGCVILPYKLEGSRVSCGLRPLETLAFCAAAQEFGALPQPPAGAQGSVSPVGCWAEGPKRPEAGQRNHERDRQGSAND